MDFITVILRSLAIIQLIKVNSLVALGLHFKVSKISVIQLMKTIFSATRKTPLQVHSVPWTFTNTRHETEKHNFKILHFYHECLALFWNLPRLSLGILLISQVWKGWGKCPRARGNMTRTTPYRYLFRMQIARIPSPKCIMHFERPHKFCKLQPDRLICVIQSLWTIS